MSVNPRPKGVQEVVGPMGEGVGCPTVRLTGGPPKRSILPPMASLAAIAERNIRDIVTLSMLHGPQAGAIVVTDDQCELARIVSGAYAQALPHGTLVKFYSSSREELMESFKSAVPGDLIVLVQSTSFRMEGFRIRVELLKRGLKVIEHSNLSRIAADEYPTYLDALAYEPEYYRGVGGRLRDRIGRAQSARVESGGLVLVYDSAFEPAKINTGDFSTLKNMASTYPIGEVFTEALHLDRVNGKVKLHCFSDTSYVINAVEEPITMVIEEGLVVGAEHSTPAFDAMLEAIREAEGRVMVRELGLGMNRAFSRGRRVSDVGAYERVCGVHLSLGAKHGVYKKPGLKNKEAKFHLDVFAITDRVLFDDDVVYQDGAWSI